MRGREILVPTVLLTGATGFVGRQILRRLIEHGYDVRAVIRSSTADKLLPTVKVEEVVEIDDLFSQSAEWWQSTCDDVDAVIHAAWFVQPGHYLSSELNLNCLAGTLTLAKGAIAARVGHFTGLGTCGEYEASMEKLTTTSPLGCNSLYSAAKISAFHLLTQLFGAAHIPFAWCRLFYLFGEDEHPSRLTPFVHRRLAAGEDAEITSGGLIRDFLDVRTAGNRIVDLALAFHDGPANVCSGKAVSIREYCETLANSYGRHDLLRFATKPSSEHPHIVGVPS